jgi:hypothetical protein
LVVLVLVVQLSSGLVFAERFVGLLKLLETEEPVSEHRQIL